VLLDDCLCATLPLGKVFICDRRAGPMGAEPERGHTDATTSTQLLALRLLPLWDTRLMAPPLRKPLTAS